MADLNRYSILFNGELRAGVKRDSALANIARLTNLDQEELLDALFSVKPVIINQVSEKALAETYQQAFSNAGLAVWVESYQPGHDEVMNAELGFSHYAPLERQQPTPNFQVDANPGQASDKSTGDIKPAYADGTCYRLVFNGQLTPGIDKRTAISNIASLTNTAPEVVTEQVFSVVPVAIIESTDIELVREYQHSFSKAGLEVGINELDESSEVLASCQLRMRDDAPPLPDVKPTPPFVYITIALLSVVFILWIAVFAFYKGYFDPSSRPAITVRLAQPPVTASQPIKQPLDEPSVIPEEVVIEAVEIPAPRKKEMPQPKQNEPSLSQIPKQENEKQVQPKPAQDSRSEQSAPVTVRQNNQPAEPTPVSPSNTQPGVLSTAEQQQVEQDYFIKLLNWFALPQHQSYDSQVRQMNLEGEIKITIRINRDGSVRDVEVLESSSEQLTQITRQSAYKASPFPPVPEIIPGDGYRFTLPLKYTLEDR